MGRGSRRVDCQYGEALRLAVYGGLTKSMARVGG